MQFMSVTSECPHVHVPIFYFARAVRLVPRSATKRISSPAEARSMPLVHLRDLATRCLCPRMRLEARIQACCRSTRLTYSH